MRAFRRNALCFATILCLGFAAIAAEPSDQQQSFPVREENGTILAARTFSKSQFEQPVEVKGPDGTPLISAAGKRQFEVRIHNPAGTDTIEPLTPISEQEKIDKPTVFYRDYMNEQGQISSHLVYTFLTPEQGGMLLVNYTTYKLAADNKPVQTPAAVPDGVYHQAKYPVHADKDSNSHFFYHISLVDGQAPLTVLPRLPTDMRMHKPSLAQRVAGVTAGATGMPLPTYNIYDNIVANIDYTLLESKNGDRQRDWMAIDARNNITYFQLTPAYPLKKGKDGAWDVHVSKDPPKLYDLRSK